MSATVVHTPRGFTALDLLAVLAVNLLWGLNMIAVKEAVVVTGPATAAAARMAIAAIVLLPWLRWMPGRMKALALIAMVSGAAFMAVINWSLSVADNVSALAIGSQLGVPFSLILGILFLGEKVHVPRIVGLVLAFAGVLIVGFDPAILHERLGLALTVVAAMMWAVGALLLRRLAGVPPLTIYAWIATLSAPLLYLLALTVEPAQARTILAIPAGAWGWIAFSAIGSTIIAQSSLATLLHRHPVSLIAPMTLAAPIVTIVSSVLFYGLPVTLPMIAGGLLTLAGVAIITIRGTRADRP